MQTYRLLQEERGETPRDLRTMVIAQEEDGKKTIYNNCYGKIGGRTLRGFKTKQGGRGPMHVNYLTPCGLYKELQNVTDIKYVGFS